MAMKRNSADCTIVTVTISRAAASCHVNTQVITQQIDHYFA